MTRKFESNHFICHWKCHKELEEIVDKNSKWKTSSRYFADERKECRVCGELTNERLVLVNY